MVGKEEREISKTKEALKEQLGMTNLGNLKYFLGIKTERSKEGMPT